MNCGWGRVLIDPSSSRWRERPGLELHPKGPGTHATKEPERFAGVRQRGTVIPQALLPVDDHKVSEEETPEVPM